MFIFGPIVLLALGMAVGKRLYPSESIVFYSGAGLLALISTISIVGTLLYYAFGLPAPILVGMTIASIAALLFLLPSLRAVASDIRTFSQEQFAWYRNHPRVEIAFALFLGLFATVIVILARSPITDAVRSPWDRVPWIVFLLFFVLALLGIILLHWLQKNPSIKSSIRIVAFLFFVMISVGWIVFPLGQGFDPFIHQTTEQLILDHGVVTPKPLYYIGQYALVVFLSTLSNVSVRWIDTLLVPLLAALFIPWAIGHWQKGAARNETPALSFMGMLLLPFFMQQFTITTPQALANLLLIVLIFSVQRVGFSVQLLLATTILLIHPLAGIPAFILLCISKIRINSYALRITCYSLLALALPFAFLLAGKFSPSINISFAPGNIMTWLTNIEWHGIYRENRFNAPLDLLYFYGFNIKNIFWFVVVTGIISWWSKREIVTCYMLHATCFLILLTSYVLMRGALSFHFLIGYEQADYAGRVLDIAHFFLLPFFLLGFAWWMERIWKHAPVVSMVAFALLITASLFLTYPQNIDRYAVSHAFNTSQTDVDAVHWIARNAGDTPYIVLANQSVSAAAVRTFGFKKYFQPTTTYSLPPTPLFYYPIPTGSPLYRYYLNMVYEMPSRATMTNAMNLVGVKRAYFVLNRYWFDFQKIKKAAEAELGAPFVLHDQDYIFTAQLP